MQYDHISDVRARHPAWALLRSRNAPLVLSFLNRTFVTPNRSNIAAAELIGLLDDELYSHNQRLGDDTYPKAARAYLDDWASAERGWLRKHYPSGSDDAFYDVTPAVERAIQWVQDLTPREFVGSESRLNTIFDLLRQMVHGSETDPEVRLLELRRQRAELDEEILRAEHGYVEALDDVAQRDRYQLFTRTARELLADFRQVEENFRNLDRELRELIAGWGGTKAELLDEVLTSRSGIEHSDQGRSFRAFYDFLLSAGRQDELTDLLRRVDQLDSLVDDRLGLTHIHFDWVDASERTQKTVRLLSEQLRRFLDDQVWLENRRVIELLRNIETSALKVRDTDIRQIPDTDLEDSKVIVVMPAERPLYQRTTQVDLVGGVIEAGDQDFSAAALREQVFVDREKLVQHVLGALGAKTQIGLEDVIDDQPLTKGLAELIGYLSLHEDGLDVVFDDEGRATIGWISDEHHRTAHGPQVTFVSERKTDS